MELEFRIKLDGWYWNIPNTELLLLCFIPSLWGPEPAFPWKWAGMSQISIFCAIKALPEMLAWEKSMEIIGREKKTRILWQSILKNYLGGDNPWCSGTKKSKPLNMRCWVFLSVPSWTVRCHLDISVLILGILTFPSSLPSKPPLNCGLCFPKTGLRFLNLLEI